MMRYSIPVTSLLAILASACSDSGPTAAELNSNLPDGGSSGSGSTSGGSGGSGATTTGGAPSGGSGGSTVTPEGGSSGTANPTGGSGGSVTGGSGGGENTAGTGGTAPVGPYDARSGTFKMLVYSKTAGFRHDASIATGKTLLTQIGAEQGFEVVITETNEDITVEGLSKYEIVFFMNSTGDIFNETEQAAYEEWMTTKNGAFGGTHSATDTENGWAFYSEVTGQYYNGHGASNTPDQIQLEANMLQFPALVGIPNPWQRNEEWYKFDSWQVWSVKPGFQILGKKAADSQPIMWIREWGNFRAFYTAIGHDGVVFEDPQVKAHLTGGIMWAVRRERCIDDQADPTCP